MKSNIVKINNLLALAFLIVVLSLTIFLPLNTVEASFIQAVNNSVQSVDKTCTGSNCGSKTNASGSSLIQAVNNSVQTINKNCTKNCGASVNTVYSGSSNRQTYIIETLNPLYISCQASPMSAQVGSNINWYATAMGGTGSYTYSWSGTDGLFGSDQSISKSYSSAGNKVGTVTVTSGSESKTANCYTNINVPQTPSLYVSCQPNYYSADTNQTITWTANPTGGTGSYTYSWSGTDGLSGNSQSISRNYPYTGTKTATITVTSGDKSASATCNTSIYAVQSYYYQYQDAVLGGSCYASTQNTQVGNNVTWQANAYGGNNYYTYYWNGSDGLYGSGQYTYKTYNTPGQKYATVTITSGGQSITRTCETNVGQVLSYTQTTQLPTLSSVYLSDLPYTGIEDYKIPLFIAGLALWSLIVAMIIYKKRSEEVIG